ncbi:MAG: hypothetical protein MJ181_06390 [Treponema sp.]|nr:hypothetical protein [Treponema sp.]
MKKLLIIAAAASMLLASCASNGGAKASGAAAPEHPMTYYLDLADAGSEIAFQDNSQYGEKGVSTRQGLPNWTSLVKANKVKAGDKVVVTGIITSPIDIDSLMVGVIDDSPAANYWTNLHAEIEGGYTLTGITANEPYEVNLEFDIAADMKGNCKAQMAYGEQNGTPVSFKVERVRESDVGLSASDVPVARTQPKEFVVDISRDLAFVEMKPEYPWENGVQNTLADPQHYQATVDITSVFGPELPIAGDTLTFTWNTKPSIDIAALKIRFVENTSAVPGWWKEIDVTPGEGHIVHENLKAYEKAEIKASLVIGESPIEGISFCITYDLDAGVSGCSLTYAK